jgi:hypothetical protein
MSFLTPWVSVLAVASWSVAPARPPLPNEGPDSLQAERRRFAESEARARRLPPQYDLLWDAAHWGAELGAALGNTDEGRAVLRQSILLASEATTTRPDGVEGHYWLAASTGLMADVEGGRTKIGFAEQAWKESARTLALDSLNAGAHHIQGRLHAAVMRLNWLTRTLAKHLLGSDLLRDASWDLAVYHLRRAAELAPGEPVNHLELGLAYLELRRPEDARRAFLAVLATPVRGALDEQYNRRARALLTMHEARVSMTGGVPRQQERGDVGWLRIAASPS